MKTLDRRQIAFLNQRHITEDALDAAITTVIDAYAGSACRGTGDPGEQRRPTGRNGISIRKA